MKLILLLVALCLFSQDRPGVKMFPLPCAAATHAHQASDYHVALVKVLDVTPCGFTFEDLEQHTVNLEPILFDSGDPLPTRALGAVGFGNKHMNVLMLCVVPVKGAFGVLVYCTHCRSGFLLEIEGK